MSCQVEIIKNKNETISLVCWKNEAEQKKKESEEQNGYSPCSSTTITEHPTESDRASEGERKREREREREQEK